MRDYLVFQLYGPLSSWGDIAVGETRAASFAPAKSAVMGLVAAALGLRRPDTTQDESLRQQWEAQHVALVEGYGMAVKLTEPGLPLTDYHTAQVPSSGSGRNRKVFATRRDELTWLPRHDLNTILSRRDYRQDAYAVIALWARPNAPYPLEHLRARLLTPEFVLYLGRKSCPLALPLNPVVAGAEYIEDAFSAFSFATVARALWGDADWAICQMPESNPMLLWDADTDVKVRVAVDQQTIFSRRDASTSRRRWQFAVRDERRAPLSKGGQP